MWATAHTSRASISQDKTAPSLSNIHMKEVQAICCLGFDCNDSSFDLQRCLVQCVPELCTRVPPGSDPPTVRSSPNKSWTKNYSILSFLMNGELFAEYERVSNMLGIPSVSKNLWLKLVEWTEEHVTELAECSCEQVRNQIRKRGDHQQWVWWFLPDARTLLKQLLWHATWLLHRWCGMVHPLNQERPWVHMGGYIERSRRKHVWWASWKCEGWKLYQVDSYGQGFVRKRYLLQLFSRRLHHLLL